MSRIATVYFDWGGVLIDNPASALRAYCAKRFGVETDAFTRAYDPFEQAFDTGQLTEREIWREVARDLRVAPPSKDMWGDAVRATFHFRPAMTRLVERLSDRGYHIGLLSNTEKPTAAYFLEHPLSCNFDTLVFSCDLGVMKPDEGIYLEALHAAGAEPDETVFIDDKEPYVRAASELGIRSILYTSETQVAHDLKKLGLDW